jgi:prevent-host-death family protein
MTRRIPAPSRPPDFEAPFLCCHLARPAGCTPRGPLPNYKWPIGPVCEPARRFGCPAAAARSWLTEAGKSSHTASPAQVSVKELRSQATRIVHRVEAGEAITITKRGRVVAVITPAAEAARRPSDSIYQQLRRHIEARTPALRQMPEGEAGRDFDRLSRKVAKTARYKDWREMDRVLKGDRFGLSR